MRKRGLGSRRAGRRRSPSLLLTITTQTRSQQFRMNEWNCPVSSLEISVLEILLPSWFVISQRIETAAPRLVFLSKPNLIAPQYAAAQQVRIMGVEDQLTVPWVC